MDTSALIRLYVPDGPIPEDMEEYLAAALKGETILLIPELELAEFAQVLWKKEMAGYLQSSEVNEIIAAALELPIEVAGHYDILTDALILARKYRLTVYDSLFLALAMKEDVKVVFIPACKHRV